MAKYFDCYRLTFTIEAEIGGYLTVENREKEENETHNLIGTIKSLQYVFRWDYVEPYHCVERETNLENCVNPLTVPDLTEQVRFILKSDHVNLMSIIYKIKVQTLHLFRFSL